MRSHLFKILNAAIKNRPGLLLNLRFYNIAERKGRRLEERSLKREDSGWHW